MTRRLNRRAGVALTSTLLAATAGCSSSSEASPTTGPVAETPSAAQSTPTAPSSSPSRSRNLDDQAIEQAERAARDYYVLVDQLGANTDDVNDPLPRLKTVAVGGGLNDARTTVMTYRTNRWRRIGTPSIALVKATDVDLTFKPKKRPPEIPTVRFNLCYDVSSVDVLDESGKSVVTADREDQTLERVWVSNYNWPDPRGWKVASTESKGEPCSGV